MFFCRLKDSAKSIKVQTTSLSRSSSSWLGRQLPKLAIPGSNPGGRMFLASTIQTQSFWPPMCFKADHFSKEMIGKKFFVTSGKAVDTVSSLNAFDAALVDAKISQCNLVPVSSILPPEAEEVPRTAIHPGSITFVVMARMDGDEGEEIAAGVAWTWESAHKYGMVAEAHGYMSRDAIDEILEWKLSEMARLRGITITEKKIRAETLTVPMDHYGSVVSALVFVPSSIDFSAR